MENHELSTFLLYCAKYFGLVFYLDKDAGAFHDILPLIFIWITDKRFIFHCLISSVAEIIVTYRDVVKVNGINCLDNLSGT